MNDFPKYIEHGAEQSLVPPGTFMGVGIYVFVLQAEREKLERLCDERLNRDPSGEVNYVPAGDRVYLAFTDVGELVSADPASGQIAYRDIALWVPVLAGRRGEPTLGRKLRLYPPYIFVDNAATLVSGREIFGLPKQLGRFRIPDPSDAADTRFVAEVVGFRGGDDRRNRWQKLLEIIPPANSPGWLARIADRADDAVARGLAALLDQGLDPGGLDFGLLDGAGVTTVGLKQMRDAEQVDRACYQSIVEAPLRAVRLYPEDARILPRGLRLRIERLESHPVEEELGIRDQEINLAAYLKADVEMGAGKEVWRAGARPAAPVRGPSSSGPATGGGLSGGPQPPGRKKIAVLGGGMAGLTAAFALSDTEELRRQYEITVYQMGWRLGGKCASGRNAEAHDRIEEHGLHVWFGFYYNSFHMLRRCYRELDRDMRKAFLPENTIILNEFHQGKWKAWPIDMPSKDGDPGDGDLPAAYWAAAEFVLSWLKDAILRLVPFARLWACPDLQALVAAAQPMALQGDLGEAFALLERAYRLATEQTVRTLAGAPGVSRFVVPAVGDGCRFGREAVALGLDLGRKTISDVAQHLQVTRCLVWRIVQARLDDDETRKVWRVLDSTTAVLTGIIEEGLWGTDLSAIDDVDYVEWLGRRLMDRSIIEGGEDGEGVSPTVRFLYNAAFAYEGGDPRRSRLGAGTAIRCLLRMLGYKGSIVYRMQAGMGDVVIAPLYEALRQRGVRFELFHRVDRLELTEDQRAISAVHVTRQVRVEPRPGEQGYAPLIRVGDLSAWPNRPDYDQIEGGRELLASGVDLEDPAAEWRDATPVTLRAEKDFDQVILAIPVRALETICPELCAASPAWEQMLTGIKTVRTQAFQVWMNRSTKDLRGKTGSPMLGTYVEPIDTYADMSHLKDVERFPQSLGVQSIGYFCGVLDERPGEGEADALARAKENARAYLEKDARYLWPKLGANRGAIWDALVDQEGRAGPARLEAQYVRVNFRPSEQYTLSVPGSTRYRLKADASGFDRLVLAGDWIDNGLNAGCVEATVMSGMQAARAISGQPSRVVGESDGAIWWGERAAEPATAWAAAWDGSSGVLPEPPPKSTQRPAPLAPAAAKRSSA